MGAARSQRRLVQGALAVLAAAQLACGGSGEAGAGAVAVGESGSAAVGLGFLERMQSAQLQTPHVGVRRYEAHVYRDGADFALAYTEEVADRGDGCFSIVPLDVESNLVSPFLFMGIQVERQAFLRRYRDFRIRDLDLFLRNYTLRDSGSSVEVAGRECRAFLVESRVGSVRRRYEVAVDVETGLVLKYRETLPDGTLLTSMTYQEFSPLPPAEVECFSSGVAEEPLDVRGDLEAQAGFDVWAPRILPDGYELLEASRVSDPRGFEWLKLTYGDGVEPLFFVQRGPSEANELGSRSAAAVPAMPPGVHGDRVLVYDVGPLSVVQGSLSSRDVIALGKVASDELLVLLQSAADPG